MNGYDIQRYDVVLGKLEDLGFKIKTQGERISIRSKDDKRFYGDFESIADVYIYLCGYETGKSEGKNGIDNS